MNRDRIIAAVKLTLVGLFLYVLMVSLAGCAISRYEQYPNGTIVIENRDFMRRREGRAFIERHPTTMRAEIQYSGNAEVEQLSRGISEGVVRGLKP
jgi:hypothetical protein